MDYLWQQTKTYTVYMAGLGYISAKFISESADPDYVIMRDEFGFLQLLLKEHVVEYKKFKSESGEV